MNCKTLFTMATLIAIFVIEKQTKGAPSNIDPTNKFSWNENVGWMNWRDGNGGVDGVFVNADYMSGYVWMENVGWLNVGDGSPADGAFYANLDHTDYGVNIDPANGDLFGLAWGENVGWVNFDTSAVTPHQARFDTSVKRFHGFAWSENTGWINLDDVVHFVKVLTGPNPPAVAPPPHDRQKNRYVSFSPNNGSEVVAFRIQKDQVAAGAGFCLTSGVACTGAPSQGTCAPGSLCVAPFPGGSPAHSCWVQAPVLSGTDIYTAKCDATPMFRMWPEPVVHVGDCEIIPSSDYTIYTNAPGPLEFVTGLTVKTAEVSSFNNKFWADVAGVNNGNEWTAPNRLTNVQDVLAILAFVSGATIRPHFVVANLQANSAADSCLNAQVNVADVLISTLAVSGANYGSPSTTKIIDTALCPVCP